MYFIHWSYFHGCFFFLFSYNIYVNMYKSGWNKASLLSLTRCNNPHLSPLKFVYIKLLCSENNLTYYINVGVGSLMNLKWPNKCAIQMQFFLSLKNIGYILHVGLNLRRIRNWYCTVYSKSNKTNCMYLYDYELSTCTGTFQVLNVNTSSKLCL